MAENKLPLRVEYPTSSVATGNLFQYLTRLAQAVNEAPKFSYTSYNGGPNSNQTGRPGELCANIVSSAQTSRLFIKELGSGNTGWVSVATTGSGFAIIASGQVALSSGAATVSTTVVTSDKSIFLTGASGGVVANIGSARVNGTTPGTSFAIASSNVLDSSNVNWFILAPR